MSIDVGTIFNRKTAYKIRKFLWTQTQRAWNLGCSTALVVSGGAAVIFSGRMIFRCIQEIRLSDVQLLQEAKLLLAEGLSSTTPGMFQPTAIGQRDWWLVSLIIFVGFLALGLWLLGQWGSRLHWYHSVPFDIADANEAYRNEVREAYRIDAAHADAR